MPRQVEASDSNQESELRSGDLSLSDDEITIQDVQKGRPPRESLIGAAVSLACESLERDYGRGSERPVCEHLHFAPPFSLELPRRDH